MRKTDLNHPFLDGLVFATFAGNLGLHVRNLTLHSKNSNFGSGLKNGLTATNDLFDVPRMNTSRNWHAGLELDVKALRSDVRKAKAKLAIQTANAAG